MLQLSDSLRETTPVTDVLVPSFSPDDAALKADPYIAFARLREHDPIHRSDLGYWVVSRHEDVRSVLMNREDFGQGNFVENIRSGRATRRQRRR